MVCHEMAFLPPSDHHHYSFQTHHHHQLHHEDPPPPPSPLNILSSFPPHDFHGAGGHVPSLTMMDHQQHHHHENQGHGGAGDDHDHDDLSDDGSQLVLGEKKKRLSLEQVKTLEKNFELGNKLEPERKMQLAKALGLQPRQIAIWFQNRRARWKTKQLEKDYNLLKRQFEALKSDNDSLLAHNKKLHSQLLALKSGTTNDSTTQGRTKFGSINLNAATKSYCWNNNASEISSDSNLGISTTSLTDLLTSSFSAPKPSDHPHQQIQDDSFCSLFGGSGAGGGAGVGEQPPFWAWAPDQHQLH